MFATLSERLSGVFRNLGGRTQLTEAHIQEGLREVRLALLEADVNFAVVKEFTEQVRDRIVGEERDKSLSANQQFIKAVNDGLVELLGADSTEVNLQKDSLNILMMVGLQGSGKTTSSAKLAQHFRRKKMRPYLVPADIYRPAAIDQLQTLAKQLDIPCFASVPNMSALDIVKQACEEARAQDCDLLIIDTAGRLHIDAPLMQELKDLKEFANPQEILLVADAMTGQDAVTTAKAFHDDLGITGLVLTKMDGDARGGAALSIKSVTGASVKFVGTGEKVSDIEVFQPDRIAGRILGMGDMLSLIEKAQSTFAEEEAEALAKKFQSATFDFEDFRQQMRRVKQMGSIESIMKMIPGLGGLSKKLGAGAVPEKEMARTEAIINSMTAKERKNPELLKATSRKNRIAKGSGTTVAEVNQLLKQFEQMRKMMQGMMGGKGKMPKGMPNMGKLAGGLGGGMPGLGGLGGLGGGGMPGLDGMPDMSALGMGGGRKSSATKVSVAKKKLERKKKKKNKR